jgi:signal transduction histidine kinase
MPLQAAHDLSNCLTPARGYVDMSREHADCPAQIREWLDRAHDCLETAFRCTNLIRGLTAAPDEVTIEPHQFDVSIVALRVYRDFQAHLEKLGITLYVDTSPMPLPVQGDGFACQRALQNLVINARDAIIRAGRNQPSVGKIAIATGKDASHVCVSVSDNGVGFSGELPEAEGDDESPRSVSEHGLGLRVVRRSMDLLGGKVDCTSFLGKGSRFILSLPILPVAIKSDPAIPTSATPLEPLPAA